MYSRFTALKNHSEKDQEKLENKTAAVIGLGATGSPIAENLARHGINLIIIDRDYLEPKDTYSSNLYTPKQCQKALPKSEAAKQKLEKYTEVESYTDSLSPENIDILDSADIILDGTDNLETRQLINDYSQKTGTPWVYTAAIAEKAYSMPFIDKCFNCIIQKKGAIATCETDGIMREIAQKAAASTSFKTVKMLLDKGINEELEIIHRGRRLDVETEGCEICENEETPHLENHREDSKVCGKNKFKLERSVSNSNILNALETGEKLVKNEYLTRIEYQGYELTFFKSGMIIVEAEDLGHAKSLISKVAGL